MKKLTIFLVTTHLITNCGERERYNRQIKPAVPRLERSLSKSTSNTPKTSTPDADDALATPAASTLSTANLLPATGIFCGTCQRERDAIDALPITKAKTERPHLTLFKSLMPSCDNVTPENTHLNLLMQLLLTPQGEINPSDVPWEFTFAYDKSANMPKIAGHFARNLATYYHNFDQYLDDFLPYMLRQDRDILEASTNNLSYLAQCTKALCKSSEIGIDPDYLNDFQKGVGTVIKLLVLNHAFAGNILATMAAGKKTIACAEYKQAFNEDPSLPICCKLAINTFQASQDLTLKKDTPLKTGLTALAKSLLPILDAPVVRPHTTKAISLIDQCLGSEI